MTGVTGITGRQDMAQITEWIRSATGGDRVGKNGSLQAFANAIGTTNSTVSRWRDGVIPGPQWREKLASALGRSEDEVEEASIDASEITLAQISAKLDRVLALLEPKGRRRG